MKTLAMEMLSAAFSMAIVACTYDASFEDCEVRCTDDSGCPEGLQCRAEGLCRTPGASDRCAICPAAYWIGPDLTWSQAQAACKMDGGHLAVINDTAENENVVAVAAGLHVWIGYTDVAEEGTWLWIEGASTFTHWATSEPNNTGGVENCAYLHAETDPGHVPSGMTGYWTDIACNTPIAYICECGS